MPSGGGRPMSALGHKRTYAPQQAMSALPPKADMCGARAHVRFGPKADINIALGTEPALLCGVKYDLSDRRKV
jgi:hypothetical protein